MVLRITPAQELTDQEIKAIVAVRIAVWPDDTTSVEDYRVREQRRPERTIYTLWSQGELFAHAETFARTIYQDGQAFKVRCLGDVFVAPEQQGNGLGRLVVQHIFDNLAQSDCLVLLFQTGVPDFYKKLGAVQVHNRFVNRQSQTPEKNPWHEQHVMIFPALSTWPQGTIDLNGGSF